jgi:hypothetical protein
LIDSSSSSVSEAGSRVKPSTRPVVRWSCGIEGADALDLVAEEIEAERLFGAAREQIDQPAAHRKLACIVDGVEADIAVGLEQHRVSLSRPIRSPGARRATSWRMRNGVRVRWVAALTVVTIRRADCSARSGARGASPSRSDMTRSVGLARS